MNDRKRIFYLMLIMAIVALFVGLISVSILYRTAFDEKKRDLIETSQSQARLIEAIARHEKREDALPEEIEDHTLNQIREAHEKLQRLTRFRGLA